MNLELFTVRENDSVISVMNKINDNARGVAFVCDEKDVLLAAVSDGDIRRFILNKGNLENPVRDIANYQPVFLEESQAGEAMAVMRKKTITAIPIVDASGCIIDIRFSVRKEVEIKSHIDIPMVIMAGGKGTRLKPYTDILPKPLIPIGNKTITEHIMDRFSAYGCTEVYMIVNHMKHFIKSYFMDSDTNKTIHFVEEEEFLGTGGGIRLLDGLIDNTFFLTNCDILIEADYAKILEYHKESGNIITLVCAEKEVVIPYGTVQVDDNKQVVGFKEKPRIATNVNTGLYLIEPEFVKMIPANTKIDITDMIQRCMDEGKKVGAYLVDEEQWMDMGQLEELEKMKEKMGFV